MAKNDLTKIDNQLEEAKKKVALLEKERKEAEENLQKQIGKIYVQIQLKMIIHEKRVFKRKQNI